jgi:hypothetical protein
LTTSQRLAPPKHPLIIVFAITAVVTLAMASRIHRSSASTDHEFMIVLCSLSCPPPQFSFYRLTVPGAPLVVPPCHHAHRRACLVELELCLVSSVSVGEHEEWAGIDAIASEVAAGRETPVTSGVLSALHEGAMGRADLLVGRPSSGLGVGPEEKKMNFPFSKI